MIYLASPYTGTEEEMQERYEAAVRCCAWLMAQGFNVYSPIVHSHPIAQVMNNQKNGEFWLEKDGPYIEMCERIAVLRLPGWEKSKGIAHEIDAFDKQGKFVGYIDQLNSFSWSKE